MCTLDTTLGYPQRKKLHGVISGERAGHSTAPEKPLERPRNFLLPGIELPGILSAQLLAVPCLESI